VNTVALPRRLAAEALGTGFLVATVVGSGIMAEKLAGGNVAIALLGNTIPTGAILVVLILALAPISGAHFNPAVSLVMAINGRLRWRELAAYVAAQLIGGCLGTLAAHAMFELPLLQLATTVRTGPAQWFAEFVATFGLLLTILALVRFRSEAIPFGVGLYITAAYWFTASTSFANPAVTIVRSLTDTFAGIAPGNVAMFVVAELVGALAGMLLMAWLLEPDRT
jgi:glycerol uptake facilitator-like aquaporin